MAKVFSPEELRAGRTPFLKDFPIIADQIHERLSKCEGVIGGFIYGSLFHGYHNIQSDIDLFVLYKRSKEDEVLDLLQELALVAGKRYIPLEIVSIDEETAQNGLSWVGPQFAHHLKLSAANGKLIKSNPFEEVKFSFASDTNDARGYFSGRIKKINKGYVRLKVMNDLYSFLENIIQLPLHIARVTLYHSGLRLENDDKREIIKKYAELASLYPEGGNIYIEFSELLAINESYKQELERQIKNGYDRNAYEKAINTLIRNIPRFKKFLQMNFELVRKTYNFT